MRDHQGHPVGGSFAKHVFDLPLLPKLSFLRGVDVAFIGEDDEEALSGGDALFLEEEPLFEFPEFCIFDFSGRGLMDFSKLSSCSSCSLLFFLASMTARIAGVSGEGVRLRHLLTRYLIKSAVNQFFQFLLAWFLNVVSRDHGIGHVIMSQPPPESQVGTASLCIAYISFCRGGERAICIIEVQEANFIFILSKLFQE